MLPAGKQDEIKQKLSTRIAVFWLSLTHHDAAHVPEKSNSQSEATLVS